MQTRFVLIAGVLATSALGCGEDSPARPVPDAGSVALPPRLSVAELQNPETCKTCHPSQYAEWAGSMHAYASNDPVFLAMNKRGQRETNGALGKFCIQCHAPMAVRTNLTTDGLNIESLPKAVQGVTCYFCHNATGAGSDHFNANVTLANDDIMRGAIKDPVDPGVHGVAYNEGHDNRKMAASELCGSCHDVVNDKGAHIEQTFAEYEATYFSIAKSGNNGGDTCQGCHMPALGAKTEVAQVPSLKLPKRDRHEHRWPAVDVALTDFPDSELHRHETECALSEDGAYIFELLHDGAGGFDIAIETTAGHAQPSGVSQDRRFWLEAIAYDANDNVLWQSGVIDDGEREEYPLLDPKHDSQLCIFRNVFENERGDEVHMFWEAAKLRENDSRLLPIAVDPLANHVARCSYKTPGRVVPARLSIRLRMRPISVTVLQDLVASGDLDPLLIPKMPTFTLHSTAVDWKPSDGDALRNPAAKPWPITCD
ncbi:MAG TPA: multiheme c-type cytochrome [Polyangiales bacterium]|nr:multiheme c-type cytochrome [Polyangiales bacterium]